MLCIIAREVGEKDSWKGRRAGETVGFHRDIEEAHVLATLYLENKLEDDLPNYIELLHPGNVEGKLAKDVLLSDHPDEKEKGLENNVLRSLYGEAFDIEQNGESIEKVSQIKALSGWDTWYELEKPQLVNWAGDKRTADNPPCLERKSIGFSETYDGFTPFTVWKIGPFTKKGPVLISLEIKLGGESYRELVTRDRTFSIDGPEHLLSRIEYSYIPRLDKEEQCLWKKELNKFRKYIGVGQSYDIVLLGKTFADEVETLEKSGITEATLQLDSKDIGTRYVTDDPNFAMSLRYALSKATINQTI
jgi:hypothetical protein